MERTLTNPNPNGSTSLLQSVGLTLVVDSGNAKEILLQRNAVKITDPRSLPKETSQAKIKILSRDVCNEVIQKDVWVFRGRSGQGPLL